MMEEGEGTGPSGPLAIQGEKAKRFGPTDFFPISEERRKTEGRGGDVLTRGGTVVGGDGDDAESAPEGALPQLEQLIQHSCDDLRVLKFEYVIDKTGEHIQNELQ